MQREEKASIAGHGSIAHPKIHTQFQPILLKGHERSITTVKYNADGDLIFTASKDTHPTVWYAESGERLGTFNHHKGAVWDIDPSFDSRYLLTASGDGNARLFNATTGEFLARMPHKGVVRCVSWGDGTKQFATAADPMHTRELGTINIFDFPTADILAEEPSPHQDIEFRAPAYTPKREINVDDNDKAVCLGFTIGDQYIIAGFDSGNLVKYDVETGKEVMRKKIHTDRINRISFNREKSLLITASKDCTATLLDPFTFQIIRVFKTERPINGAVISPTHPHIIIGGGQDAQSVTTTSASQGKFESRFFHMVYGTEFGRVKGHFGPINALAVHPFGKSYASGSEDGFIRLHTFDVAYLTAPDYVDSDIKSN